MSETRDNSGKCQAATAYTFVLEKDWTSSSYRNRNMMLARVLKTRGKSSLYIISVSTMSSSSSELWCVLWSERQPPSSSSILSHMCDSVFCPALGILARCLRNDTSECAVTVIKTLSLFKRVKICHLALYQSSKFLVHFPHFYKWSSFYILCKQPELWLIFIFSMSKFINFIL